MKSACVSRPVGNKCQKNPPPFAALRKAENSGNSCLFRILGLRRRPKIKPKSYGFLKTIKNLAQTIGFHHPHLKLESMHQVSFQRVPWEPPKIPRKLLEFLVFLATLDWWNTIMLAATLARHGKSYGYWKTLENHWFPYVPAIHGWLAMIRLHHHIHNIGPQTMAYYMHADH